MKRFLALILAMAGFAGVLSSGVLADDTKNSVISDDGDNKGAWVILSDTVKEHNMTFFDGGQKDTKSPTFNEKVILDGVEGRKVYKENYVYFRFDDSFFDLQNDHDFFITLDFYQFGPERGQFTFQYSSLSGTQSKTIYKEKDPRWASTTFFVTDAFFNHSIDDVGADIKIVSGVYNAFAKIEVINARALADDNDFDVGIVATDHARVLHQLGLYAPGEYDPALNLDKKLTRASAAEKIVKIIGKEKEAENYSSSVSGTTDKENHAVGYLQNKDYADWSRDPQSPVTQRELLEVFARIQGVSLEGDLFQNALDNDLLLKADMMMQPGKTAIEDNLVSLGFNWLVMMGKRGNMNIADLMEDGLIDEETVKNATDPKISSLYYAKPRKLGKVEMIDATTGRKYYYVDRGSQLVRDYYTANLWTADNKRFIVEDTDSNGAKYIYDTEKDTLQYLAYCYNPVVSKGTDNMYYVVADTKGRRVMRMNLNTFKAEKVADFPSNITNCWGATLTDDEKYMSCNWADTTDPLDLATPYGGFRQRKTPILDIETGVWDTSFHKEFMGYNNEGMVLNHVILNPVYDNLVFFCHEGTAENTPDRIWLMDRNTNEAFNLFRQKQVSEVLTGEPAGHEMWFGNGERLAFVKYPKQGNIAYSGIMTIDLTGKHKEYVNNEYQYWHCCASPADDRFIVADTNKFVSEGSVEIVLIDRYTGEAHLLCKPRLGNVNHPGQAHPSFSQDGRKVNFVINNGNGVIATAWMDISDIVDKPAEGGRISISDECEAPSYKGCVNYIEESSRADAECYKVPAGNRMLVNVKDEKYQGDRVDASVSFKYFDEGFTPVRLTYFGWNEDLLSLDKTEQMRYEIPRKNTKQWLEAKVNLKDINLDNMEFIGTDIRIEGAYADLYIKDIDVEVTNVISEFMDQLPWTTYNKPAEG